MSGIALFDREPSRSPVSAAVIGVGHFATALVTQSASMSRLDVQAVADLDAEAGMRAFRLAGVDEKDIVRVDTAKGARDAWESGRRIVAEDPSLLMDLPVDIVVEATGLPEAGARHAVMAIQAGKHLAMVSKDLDIVVGPILKRMADDAGLVYTPVDGDQHGLLIQLIEWIQELGLKLICGGKFLEFDVVVDENLGELRCEGATRPLAADEGDLFRRLPEQRLTDALPLRRRSAGSMGGLMGYDVVEMALVANATGLRPDIEELHCPLLRLTEIPVAFNAVDRGGLLERTGVIDAATCLRYPFEAGMGGGVFAVVACDNAYSREILMTKGMVSNPAEDAGLIYRPYHLCGVETPISLLSAALLGAPTGASRFRPDYDVFARANAPLKAGSVVGSDKSPDLTALMRPAMPVAPGNPIPLHLARGNRLKADVSAGQVIALDHVEEPEHSELWRLRRRQDALFLGTPLAAAKPG